MVNKNNYVFGIGSRETKANLKDFYQRGVLGKTIYTKYEYIQRTIYSTEFVTIETNRNYIRNGMAGSSLNA